jgi:pimeloyl-ACP methyl ester carboxylesterase
MSPEVDIEVHMVGVTEGVTIRTVTFTPRKETSNPIVVFVAGWITQITSWKSVLSEMMGDFKIIYIETREKISSRIQGKAGFGVTDIGKDVAALIDILKLKEKDYLLFGSSLGATAIIDCYRFIKHKPLALVLICPNAVFRVPATWKFIVKNFYPPLYNLIKPPVKWYLKNFRLDVKTDSEQYKKYCSNIDAADPWKLKPAVLAVSTYQVWDRLKEIDCPTLMVGASKDLLHEHENQKRMASMIQNVTIVDLETNANTHSKNVVGVMRKYLKQIM